MKRKKGSDMKIRIKPHLFTEAAMIVFSVLLALFLSEWISSIKQKNEARQVLTLVHKELKQNLQVFEEWSERHKKIELKIREVISNDSLKQLAFTENGIKTDYLFGTRIYQSAPSSTSWKIASKGNYARNWSVATLFSLSELYKIQETGVMETIGRVVDVLYTPSLMDQKAADINTLFFLGQFSQVYNQEIYLIGRYKKTIEQVEKELGL